MSRGREAAPPLAGGRGLCRPAPVPAGCACRMRRPAALFPLVGHHHQAEGQADLLPSLQASIQNRQGRARQKSDRPLPSQAAASSGKSVDSGLKLL